MLTVVILTWNEEIHIRRAVENVRGWAHDVFIVDSFSGDRTCEVAEEAGARVFQHVFENYSAQREWALRELPYETEWILFLDADELVSSELKDEIDQVLAGVHEAVDGFFVKFRLYWMGKWLRHGGLYPTWLLRLVRHRHARCDSRGVNEHLSVERETGRLQNDLLHVDLKPISDWFAKHIRYATLEAHVLLRSNSEGQQVGYARFWGSQAQRKRWIFERIWKPLLPPLARPFLFFCYTYFFRLGFLDGRIGFVYHVLWAFSWRFNIEAKYMVLKAHGSEAVNPMDYGVGSGGYCRVSTSGPGAGAARERPVHPSVLAKEKGEVAPAP